MNKTALVICNGEPPSRKLARALARRCGMIVAADGGANVARAYGIRPDIIIGDLDSIQPATRKVFASSTLIHLTRQDNTDLEKALDMLVAKGVREAIIIGATGRRLDFTLGNLSVLWVYANKVNLRCEGDGWRAIPLGRSGHCRARIGTTVSLIPFGNCSGITLRGLKYPLTNATMKMGEIGVSNVALKQTFTVRVRRGKMLLVLLDPARRSR